MPYDAGAEFDRQVRTVLDLGYPALAGLSATGLTDLLEPLRAGAVEHGRRLEPPTRDRIPFVLVVTSKLAPVAGSMPLTALKGAGAVSPLLADVDRFVPVDSVPVPAGGAYVLLDVDRGAEFRDVPPDGALPTIAARDRTPLTIEEGIAVVTHFPAALEKNHCFSLAASRCGDRRVPAVWISKGAPMLGWCWAGTPHSWLGVASCAGRIGADLA